MFKKWALLFRHISRKPIDLALTVRTTNRYGIICAPKLILYAPPKTVREFKLKAREFLLRQVNDYKKALKIPIPKLPDFDFKIQSEIPPDRLNSVLVEFVRSVYPDAKFYLEDTSWQSALVLIKSKDKKVGLTIIRR